MTYLGLQGFFHDLMSNAIDGSVLAEHDLEMNIGLCRWTQCVSCVQVDMTRPFQFVS